MHQLYQDNEERILVAKGQLEALERQKVAMANLATSLRKTYETLQEAEKTTSLNLGSDLLNLSPKELEDLNQYLRKIQEFESHLKQSEFFQEVSSHSSWSEMCPAYLFDSSL